MANNKKKEEEVIRPRVVGAKTTTSEKTTKPEKDPGIAALIAAVCGLFLAAPSLGYFYLNKVKKGVAWLVIGWIIVGILAVTGSLCLFPLVFIPIYYIIIIWDVYLEAQGKPAKLPDIWEEK
jgi:hypothetical protein